MQNPLRVTDYMKQWRVDNKVHVVVMMRARDFLSLTTWSAAGDGKITPEVIAREARSLDQYNEWAARRDMMPIHLSILVWSGPDGRDGQVGQVAGHEGRHRVAAMIAAGESVVEVSLRLVESDGSIHRHRTALDLPRWLHAEFEPHRRVDLGQSIRYVIDTNVQRPYNDRDPDIKRARLPRAMATATLAKRLRWPRPKRRNSVSSGDVDPQGDWAEVFATHPTKADELRRLKYAYNSLTAAIDRAYATGYGLEAAPDMEQRAEAALERMEAILCDLEEACPLDVTESETEGHGAHLSEGIREVEDLERQLAFPYAEALRGNRWGFRGLDDPNLIANLRGTIASYAGIRREDLPLSDAEVLAEAKAAYERLDALHRRLRARKPGKAVGEARRFVRSARKARKRRRNPRDDEALRRAAWKRTLHGPDCR